MPGPVSSIAVNSESDVPSSASTRRRLSISLVVLLTAVAASFIAYALGYLPKSGLLEAVVPSSQSPTISTLTPAFGGIVGLFGFFLLLALLRAVEMLSQRLRKKTAPASKPAKQIEQFLSEAAGASISNRVAQESYRLLERHYPQAMSIDLADSLRGDLRLSDDLIITLETELLARCGREGRSAAGSSAKLPTLVTVRDLLLRVERAAPLRTLTPEPSERVSGPDSRGSSSGQRKALHAMALQAIETRSLRHHPEPTKKHRRSSDYEGPRRRTTDERAEPAYKGPRRRSTDLSVTPSSDRIA